MGRFRKRARSRARFFSKRKGRSRSIGSSTKLIQADAMVYGALRNYASNLIAPVTSMIPMGNLADEIGMGILDYLIAKKMGSGFLGSIARKGLVIENAFVGSTIASGSLNLLGSGSTARQDNIYG